MAAKGETVADWIAAGPWGSKSALADRCGVTSTEVGRWAKGTIPHRRYWPAIEQQYGKASGTIAQMPTVTAAKTAAARLEGRVSALEREMAAQRKILEDIRDEVRAPGSGRRSRR